MDTTPSPTPSSSSPSVGVPAAIVIAGGLIALAIYFGNSRVSTTPTPVTASPLVAASVAPAPAVPTIGAIRPVTDTDHVRGPADAKITLIEYSDLECPFCKRFHPTVQRLMTEYPNDVRWVYRHFPLEQLHQQAKPEAIATECAGDQGKFWELTDKIYEVTTSNDGLDLTTLPTLARQVGVANIPTFEACLKSTKHDARIAADMADAQTAGGQGTPYTILMTADGRKTPISGALAYETVKAEVDKLLAQ